MRIPARNVLTIAKRYAALEHPDEAWAEHIRYLVHGVRDRGYTPESMTPEEREAVCLYLVTHPRRRATH